MDELSRLSECTGFEWDQGNAEKNWERHGVSRGEAEQVFFNQPLLVTTSNRRDLPEERLYALGKTDAARLLFIVFAIRNERIRVISVRDMSRKEREAYENS